MSKTFGCVNWFDNKKGYGFVTIVSPESENVGKDIFLHFSNLNISDNYKRVYPGEYIEFNVESGEDGRLSCVDVTGICGGPLLIENKNHTYRIYPRMRREEDAEDESTEVPDADESTEVANADESVADESVEVNEDCNN